MRGRLWQVSHAQDGILRSDLTVNIALFLSSDGIALAHRQTAGHWAMIGETALDVPDLSAALAGLRTLAVEREGDDFEVLLVLPDDQILYTSLTAPTAVREQTEFRIEEGLEGLTPYSVTELEYDWHILEEDRVKIAVVARETLDEARGFAAQYGFISRGFVATPPTERFAGVPTFGLGADAAEIGFASTVDGLEFGPDSFGIPEPEPEPEPEIIPPAAEPEVVSPAAEPEFVEPEPDPIAPESVPDEAVAAPTEDLADAIVPEPAPSAPETPEPFTAPEVAPQDTIPVQAPPAFVPPEPTVEARAPASIPELAPEQTAAPQPQSAPEPPAENPALAEAILAAQEAEAANELAQAPVQTIEDPSVSGPVASIATDTDNATSPPPPTEAVGDAGEADDALPPAPSPASREARQRAREIRNDAPNVAPLPGEAGQFAARRGPTTAPEAARGALVGQRNSRVGLAHPDGPPRSVAPPAPATPEPAPEAAAPAAPMPRLAEQLQRVRNASKTRPQGSSGTPVQPPRPRVEITPQPATGTTGATAERRPSPFDTPPASSKSASEGRTSRLGGMLSGLTAKRGGGADKEQATVTASAPPAEPSPRGSGLLRRRTAAAPAVAAGEAVVAEDETFASGLLARKSVKPTGGSFKTGLVLTIILLLLLALVAIWSAVFLPNSTVARLLGMGDATPEVAAVSGLPAPDVVTTAPTFGAVDTVEPSLADEAAADGVDLVETTAESPVAVDEDADSTLEVAEAAAVDAALPDIDAELDLPPLPAIDQGQNPTEEEALALYAEDGIWARSPDRPDLRPFDLQDSVYTASIDPEVSAFDAVALPDPGVNPGELLRRFPPPPAFGTAFDLTASGLVAPTPEGVLTPEGAFVISGVPPRVAVQRPREVVSAAPAIVTDDAILGTFRPEERPGDLSETRERQILGGLTQVELGERRPSARPASPQEAAAEASLFPGGDGGADPEAVEEAVAEALAGTELAIARSLLPRTRPANIAQIVASADRTPTQAPTAVAAEAVAAGPSIPSNADVSRAATERNAIRLRNVNLIGVSGSSSDRRALVRLSSGRFVRVTVGDRLDGGRVAAIGETTLQYVRSGRTLTLEIPG